MRFKEMTGEDIQYFTEVYKNKKLSWDERMQVLMKFTGKSERTVRKWASERLKLAEKDDVVSPEYEKAKTRKFNSKKKRFIITWAQNNTPVHLKFFHNLVGYAEHIKADIHVIAGRYRNPTSIWTMGQQSEEKWSPVVLPYLDAGRHDIHQYLSIMSDVKIHPTAHNPMSGMEAMSGVNSCIFGHPKLQMQTIPVLEDSKPKMMLTTGACTVNNYTDSKAGKKGEFHHVLGFVIVEIEDDKTFHVRQVSAEDNGDFCDLYNEVKFKGKEAKLKFADPLDKADYLDAHFIDEPIVIEGETKIDNMDKIEACVLGDLHWGHHDPEVIESTTKMLDRIKPKHVILHDVFDGYSISHHTMKNPFIQYGKEVRDENNLQKEVDEMLEGLGNFSHHPNVVVVRSNHDDFIDRWLINGDWKKQPTPKNSPLYMEYSAILLRQHAEGGESIKGVIPEIINRKYPKFKTLGRGDSYKVLGWELGQHGDMGSNGSRGSLLQFRKLNTKIIVGHYHCLPAEYKVQTKEKGWVEIRSIKKGDTILSYDPESKKNVWNVVNEFIETDYNGTMLQINGNGFEQTFTDKHMLMLNDGSYIPASEAICSRSSSELPLSALPEDTHGKSIPSEHVKQIVAIAADGSQDGYRIRFHLKKERKIKRLKELFGDNLNIYTDEDGNFDGYISTRSDLYSKLMEYKYNLKTTKNISVEILDWDNNSLQVLIEELKHWDGTFDTGNNGNQYSTTNKVEANVISSALNRLGYSHSTSKREYDNENHKTLNIITWCDDRDVVRNSKKMNHSVRFTGWGFNSYQAKTKVYCVSVDNKCFWIQSAKTGDVSLTGNSPGRKDGALAVGTSTKMRVGYNMGPSSWLQSHVIIHKNGKAQHINFVRDKNNEMGYTTMK